MMQYKTSLLKYNYEWLILGLVIIIGSSISYTAIINNYFQNLNNLIQYVGVLYIFSIVLGLLMISIQIQKVLMSQREIKLNNNVIPLGLISLTYDLFTKAKYRKIFIISSVIYVIIFSVISGTIVYQPEIIFSEAYDVSIPSIKVVYCCGTLGQYPNAAIYVTEHVGLMVIPLSTLLLILISGLVAWNVMLITFALSNRPKNNGKWLFSQFLQIGAFTGLFTACPTCAGLILTSVLPSSIAVSAVTGTMLLSLSNVVYQQIFLVITLGLLIGSPLILIRNIRELFENGCIIEKTSII